MDALGINFGLLLEQAFFVILLMGLPIISLIDLARKRLSGIPLAIWTLVICVVPVIGSLAYWIIKPTYPEV
jgi:phospholipase D-like protein